jgi:hypothetical protein
MYIFPSLFAASILAALTIAAPPPQEALGLRPKACSIKLPTSYQQINQSAPTQSYPQNFVFKVSQSVGGGFNIGTLLRFSGIPSGSTGCTLAMSFTFEYPINSTGSALVSVYALSNNISRSDTWGTYFPNGRKGTPAGGFLFGSTTISGQKAVINSETCKNSLNYLFLIASDDKAGEVAFVDAGNNLSGIGGFYIAYNC